MIKTIYCWAAAVLILVSGQVRAGEGVIRHVYSDWRPMCYTDDMGRASGLLLDIARIVMEEELGLTLEGSARPWKRAQKEVETGESDFLISVATKARREYALVSESVFYQLPLYVYTYRGHEKQKAIDAIKDVSDIKRLKLVPVTNLGNGWHKENIDAHGINTHYAGKEENILYLLANRRADIVIDAKVPTNYLIDKFGLNQKVVLTASRFSQVDFHLLLSKRSRFAPMLGQMDAAFSRAREKGRIQKVISAYEGPSSP